MVVYSFDRVGKRLRGTGRRPDCGPVPWFCDVVDQCIVDVQAMLWACFLVLGGGDLIGNGEVKI